MARIIDFDQLTEYKTAAGIYRIPLAAQPLDNPASLSAIAEGLSNAATLGRAVTLDATEAGALKTTLTDTYAADVIDNEIGDVVDARAIVEALLRVRSFPVWGPGLVCVRDVTTVFWDGTLWVCVQSHTVTTDPNWRPGVALSLWRRYYDSGAGVQEWAYPVAYEIGDRVTYGGKLYECRQSHTSQAGWTPAVVLALWLPV